MAALEDLGRAPAIASASARELASGARPSCRPAATSVGAVIRPSRAKVSCRRRASSWRRAPSSGSTSTPRALGDLRAQQRVRRGAVDEPDQPAARWAPGSRAPRAVGLRTRPHPRSRCTRAPSGSRARARRSRAPGRPSHQTKSRPARSAAATNGPRAPAHRRRSPPSTAGPPGSCASATGRGRGGHRRRRRTRPRPARRTDPAPRRRSLPVPGISSSGGPEPARSKQMSASARCAISRVLGPVRRAS